MDNANPELEFGDESNGNTFREQNADSGTDRKLSYTKYLTPSKLIELYCLICRIYDRQSCLKYQRASNFKLRFTDQELITVYLFGHLNGLYQKKAIYRFARHYWATWFPDLPSYQAFNRRLNLLESAFRAIGSALLNTLADPQAAEIDHLIDSMPVMLASGTFSRRARVTRDVANRGYCAAKRLHFHGVRLHFIAAVATPFLAQRSQHSRLDGTQRATHLFAELNAFRRQGVLQHESGNSVQTAEHMAFSAEKENQRQRT